MSKDERTQIDGSCHCKNIQFVLRWPGADTEMPVRKCGCTFCRKHGGAWTSHRDAELNATFADLSQITKYNFGTKTADFYVCSVCGVVPFVVSEIEQTAYAVVNVNALHDIDRYSVARSATNFDGEATCARLDRRKRNWIPAVAVNDRRERS